MRAHGSGRLVADPELKPVNDTYVCKFRLADNEYIGRAGDEKKEVTHFYDCEVWAGAAKYIAERCKKGTLLIIDDAILRQDIWDGNDGKKKSKLYLRINEFKIAPARNILPPQEQVNTSVDDDDDDDEAPF